METDLFNYQSTYGPNTNFRFPADTNTHYLKTSAGEKLPFKLFRGDKYADTGSGILRERNSKGYPTDFALVERQFSESESLSFHAGTRVSDVNDVAWLFRSLESEAVEHTFALYRFKDDSYLVQHLSTGGITCAVVDLRLLAGNVFKMQPESITLVHNHPSGQLLSSIQDRQMLQRLHDIFDPAGIKVEDGIVINLRSGKYLVFSNESGTDRVRQLYKQDQVQGKVSAFSFNKQIFAANYQPFKISSPEDTAAYISSQKFGLSDKTEALILNNGNEIVGKFILPQRRQFEKLTELLTTYAGTGVILYGNNVNEKMYKEYRDKLDLMGFSALDAILLKSGNYHSLYEKSDINISDHLMKKFSRTSSVSAPPATKLQAIHSPSDGEKAPSQADKRELGPLPFILDKNPSGAQAPDAETIQPQNPPGPFAPYEEIYGKQSVKERPHSGDGAAKFTITLDEDNIQKYSVNKLNIINQNLNIMQEQEFNLSDYLKNQLKYLGFGEHEKLHKDLEKGIKGKNQEFEIKTASDKGLPGNQIDFSLKFNKTENGGVFLNAYQAKLNREDGQELTHNFPVTRENTFTAKEALNLLEGRSVKIEFHNPKSDQSETAFVQFNFDEPKTEKGNFMFQNFYKNYGIDTDKIVEKANLIFDKPEYRENTIKSLEKGNIVKVKFEIDDQVVEGKAVLNPQYKNLNLYDSEMNRLNTNKPLQGLDIGEKHDKANVREQSLKR